ncbi:baseplate assembly protein [Cedecea neteri]|uniref:Baseplate assembly protein n=1 Tax=Cedecea neteri TaxID=158822 RepID=A0A089PSW5_9ENTR|nr:GPW/gp25 family protein [Cedecea neteri]AIR03402.1 baseplate assembly protein [Cedecea neteri]
MNGVNAKNGKALSGDEHLQQSVGDILSTPIGSRVLNRLYGSKLPSRLDNPQDNVTRVRIIADTAGALAIWEPRLQVQKVEVFFIKFGEFELAINGKNRETGEALRLTGLNFNGNKYINN